MLAGVVKAAKEKWTPKVEVCFKVSAVYDVVRRCRFKINHWFNG